MTAFSTTSTSGHSLPDGWGAEATQRGLHLGTDILVLDCISGDDIQLLLRPEMKGGLPDALTYLVDGMPTTPSIAPIPRGTSVTLPKGDALVLKLGAVELPIPVRPIDNTLAGKNVVMALINHDHADDLTEWLAFHAETQGANAALLVNRLPGDNAKLRDAMSEVKIAGLDHILWLDVTTPIGHAEMGPETARLYAPDAPGKALLDPLAPDPWRAPFYEVGLLEALRRRFLTDARAVLFCTPADFIFGQEENVFDAAVAGSGFLRFDGARVYPFATKNIDRPKFGEHNCRAFDGKRSNMIWCLAPAKQPEGTFWRQFRIRAPIDPASQAFTYWRFMALRHPGLKPSELVAKTALVEMPELSRFIKQRFDAAPKAPPAPATGHDKPLKNDRILIVTPMKNEGPFIIEWIAYHLSIGVTNFLIHTNDCTDGTNELFDILDAKGIVEHRDNPYRQSDDGPQRAALFDAQNSELAAQADWIIAMDADEFINIHVGDGTMHDLFAAVPGATMFSMTWRLFGNADIGPYVDEPVIEQFTHAAHPMTRKPHQAWGFKTLFRNLGHYKKIGVHRPKGLRPEYLDNIHWVNGSGKEFPKSMLRTGWRSNVRTIGYDLVTMNHYAVKSAESYMVKRARGRAYHVERSLGLSYWFRMNHNATTDTSISTKFARFRKEYARLMSDPEIAEAHAHCVAAHKARIAELMATDEYRDLYQEVTGERLRMLSRNLHHFGTKTFLDGPEAVPQDFAPDPVEKSPKAG